jgi:hypothetical protein
MNHPTHLEQPQNKDPQCNYHQIALQRVALLVGACNFVLLFRIFFIIILDFIFQKNLFLLFFN